MNSRQTRKLAREFCAMVKQMLPAEYNAQVTAELVQANRRIACLEKQLMQRDGFLELKDDHE